MVKEGEIFQAKEEIEEKVYEIAKANGLESLDIIRILALMTSDLAQYSQKNSK